MNKKLSELRKSRGMTQQELAEALNVSRQTVSRWEVGTVVPTLDNLICLSKLYGVPLDEFTLAQDESEPVPEVLPEAILADTPTDIVRSRTPLVSALLAVLILGVGILIGLSLRKEPDQRVLLYTAPQIDANSQVTVGWLEKTPADRSDEAQWLETVSGEASEEAQNLP